MSTPVPVNRARFTTSTAVDATRGRIVRGSLEREHASLTTDSRAVDRGGAFVALRGERFDGHAFLDGAVEAGATLLVVEEATELPPVAERENASGSIDVIFVKDTLVAWGDLARAHRRRWGGKIVAVTGSAGKTTTKELCAQILAGVAPTLATVGNLNNRIGVPATLFCLEPHHRFAVIEMGMSLHGEIAALAAIAEPDVAAVTNVGMAHAEGVGGSRADVAREKFAIFARSATIPVGNADDGLPLPSRAVTFGQSSEATYRLAARTSRGADGSACEIVCGDRVLLLHLPLIGLAAALDLACAVAAAEEACATKLSASAIDAALGQLALPAGRGVVRRRADGLVVFDDSYNANPASMRAALESLRELAQGEGRRAIAVLGEMKELGPAEHELHGALGADIAAFGVSLAIGCGGLVDVALERAAASGVEVARGRDVVEAATLARARAGRGDVVLVKGSRSVGTERVVAELLRQP